MNIVKRLLAAAAALLLLGGCSGQQKLESSQIPLPPSSQSQLQEASVSSQEPAQPETRHGVLVAAGDNLIHDVIYLQAQRRTGGTGYDFAPAYENIAPLVADADFAFINQETILAGAALPLSNYPRFCSPPEVGEEILSLGFNLISTANNHCFDQGQEGLNASQSFWDSHPEAAVTGSYATQDHGDRVPVITNEEGIRVALIAATELTNGLTLPTGSEGGVLLLSQMDTIREKLAQAREEADVVVLSLHWGAEGAFVPSDSQKELARQLAEAGADIILGHHSHVLQGGEWLTTSRGRSYVAYSLGNFISAQVGAENMLAGLLRLEFSVTEGQGVELEQVEFIPTVTHYGPGFSRLTILPLSEYTAEQAASHGVRQYDADFSLDYLQRQLGSLDFGVLEKSDA